MKDKVLLVDDDAMVLSGLKRRLRKQFHIETALSGEEAINKVRDNGPFAVIVSDFHMPGMNGIEFLCQVKETNPDTVRMMLTGNDAAAEKASVIVNQGQINKYDHVMVGFNYRMMDTQAVMGLEQLRKLDRMNRKRGENASYLTKRLRKIDWLETPYVGKGVKHVWHQYTIKVSAGMRDEFVDYLNSNGVGARVYYPKPVHMQPAYQALGYAAGLCPVSESISKQVLSLPVHPNLKKAELKEIVEVIEKYR